MPRIPRRFIYSAGRILLIVLFLGVALFAGSRCLFRAPEQTPATPTVPQQPPVEEESDAQAEAEALAAAEALRRHTERKDNFYTILISGADDQNGGCDTNILLAVNVDGGYIHGVSIPRDTKAIIRGEKQKINAAYNIGGMELMSEVVSDQLGIPVDYTVLVDLQGFEDLVNAIGGVTFNVPIDMDYDDPLQDLSIHFTAGTQYLNGEDALKVVRFRHNNDGTGYGSEDIGRMETQQKFLKTVAKQTLTVNNLGKIDEFVKIFQAYVDTDLTLGNLAWLGKEAIGMGVENINFSTLSSNWNSPYIYLDPDETLALVNQYLNPFVEDRVPEDLNIPE